MNRRGFLAGALALGAGLAFRVRADGLPETLPEPALPEAWDEIDHNAVVHRVRDGEALPRRAQPEAEHAVVIVGGGISGLTALSELPAGTDALLLEKEAETGGHSRRRRIRGVWCPLGALVSQGPIAPFTSRLNALGVAFRPLPVPGLAWRIGGRLCEEPLGAGIDALPLPAAERAAFRAAADELAGYRDPATGIFFPRSDNRPEIRALDAITLHEHIARRGWPESLKKLLDGLLAVRIGEDGSQVSAWTALWLLSAIGGDNYSFPGGHGALGERLAAQALDGRPQALRRGWTVTALTPLAAGGVRVDALDADGAPRCVQAGTVVLAAPKLYARRLLPQLATERPGVYESFRYNAYLLAQVSLKHPVGRCFETLVSEPSPRMYVAADRLDPEANGRGHMTIYVPMSGSAGRARLLGAHPRALAAELLDGLYQNFPEARGAVEEIRLQRWGHPLVSPRPGQDATLAAAREPWGDIVFAHSDTFGVSGLYSALWTGIDAAAEVQVRLLARQTPTRNEEHAHVQVA